MSRAAPALSSASILVPFPQAPLPCPMPDAPAYGKQKLRGVRGARAYRSLHHRSVVIRDVGLVGRKDRLSADDAELNATGWVVHTQCSISPVLAPLYIDDRKSWNESSKIGVMNQSYSWLC